MYAANYLSCMSALSPCVLGRPRAAPPPKDEEGVAHFSLARFGWEGAKRCGLREQFALVCESNGHPNDECTCPAVECRLLKEPAVVFQLNSFSLGQPEEFQLSAI